MFKDLIERFLSHVTWDAFTTIIGLMAAAVLLSGVKTDALIAGDPVALRLAGGAVLGAVLGWLALKAPAGIASSALGKVVGGFGKIFKA